MIRIHCSTWDEADAAWQMIAHVPDEQFQTAELHLDGHGPLYQIVRDPTGYQFQSAVPIPNRQV